ncbi:MAG: aldehyde dehydrogenase [Bradyrhizobium sp.]|nr:aldehyde dehydrogenase [Bradyrhizobium sp.]
MDNALADTGPLARPRHFFIDGEWASPSSDATIDVITPSTEQRFFTVAEAQQPDINRAVAAARRAFDQGPWPRMSHAERAGFLSEIGKLVTARAPELAMIWTGEVGAVRTLSDAVTPMMGGVYDYYASLATTFPFVERHLPMGGGQVGLLVREPVGVVAAIIPWNSALSMIAYKIAPALLAGCTVVVKSSPEAPGAAHVMAEIVEAVGLPRGVFNFVTSERAASELLVRHPGVDKVTFTGSSAAGKAIGAICAQRVARCTLELGGKSAAIVLDDYDPAIVARSIAGSTRLLSGQICSSLTRLIVSRDRHDQLLEAVAAEFSRINVGDPFDGTTEMGPLAMRRQRDRVEAYIAAGKAQGATLAAGGVRPRHLDRGYYIEPTVFGHVRNDMTIAREEIFGPVVSIIAAADEAHAITIADDSDYGLNASVFTNDVDRAYLVARQLRTGTVGHNSFRTDFSIAFGGFKQSGIGREGGIEGLHPFLESKTIILDGVPSTP